MFKIMPFLKMGILIGVPIFLLVQKATYFDQGVSLCPSKFLLNIECLGCGMTRACMHIIHFDFETAWNFNKLSFIVFPILCFCWAKWGYETFNQLLKR